jgi:uncharacterized protein (TIGR03000 family)
MKKAAFILFLTSMLVLIAATDASAQVPLTIGRGLVNVGVSPGYSYGGPYYYGNNWGSPYYWTYRPNSYFGPSYFSSPGYVYTSPGYPAPAYTMPPFYTYSTPGYSTVPVYGYATNGTESSTQSSTQSSTSARTSFYQDPNSANVTIFVPNTDAEIWFDGTQTKQRGFERNFHTPPLPAGTSYYTIRARWDDGITAVDQERKVEVFPGQSVTVDFRQR